jgi:ubiquinone/menaquinone biosynthesis C-methylase UbiE
VKGHEGWDAYAPYYDWENARTMGRRDVRFWTGVAQRVGGRVLELGSGTGRLTVPLTRAGIPIIGIDRSPAMLARVRPRARRSRTVVPHITRGDITTLPFAPGTFRLVMAPYGLVQSLLSDAVLARTLREAARVLAPGGTLGIDLVPDVPRWRQYTRKVVLFSPRGPRGLPLTLIETVRQDRVRGLTTFEQEYVEGRGRTRQVTPFTIRFRTLPLPSFISRLARAGFDVDTVLGDYRGQPWDPRAEALILLARRRA